MKTKQLCKFITLFEFVPLAGEILSGKTIPEAAGSQISEALKPLREIRDDPDNGSTIRRVLNSFLLLL